MPIKALFHALQTTSSKGNTSEIPSCQLVRCSLNLPSKRVRFVGVPDEDGLDRLARVERAGLERHESLNKIRLFNLLR